MTTAQSLVRRSQHLLTVWRDQVLSGKSYRLQQFHFHMSSETRINGKQFPLEAQFVHQDSNGQVRRTPLCTHARAHARTRARTRATAQYLVVAVLFRTDHRGGSHRADSAIEMLRECTSARVHAIVRERASV